MRLVGVVMVVAVVAAGGWWLTSSGVVAGPSASGDPDAQSATGRQTVAVERTTLTVTEEFGATLGYDAEYEVLGGLAGTLTWVVPVGTIVTSGQRLYETDGVNRASLMYGSRPAWRSLEAGVANGADIRQLEENLRTLGYTRRGDVIDSHWDADTTAAVKRWQKAARLIADGSVELGEVAFLPEAIRVTEVGASLGSMVGGGGALLTGTSTRRVVSLDLETDDRDLFEVDKAVDVELPDGSTVAGKVQSIGRIATTSTSQEGGSTTTLPVTITLDDPEAVEDLDQAAVGVTVVRSSRENVLTVPVNALLALREGGYAVEVVDAARGATASPSGSPAAESPASSGAASSAPQTHLVRVEPGLFDSGMVEITATGIEPGDLVVVPS